MSDRSARVGLIVVSVAGVLISAYLVWSHVLGVAPVCVAGSGGCEVVQTSRYATIQGVPVAALGLVAYVGLLFSTLLRNDIGVLLGLFVALVGTLFSAYLTWLELYVIHAICQYCVASAVLMVASLILAAARFGQLKNQREPGQ